MKSHRVKAAGTESFSGWLIDLLCEVSPSLLEDGIPERDLMEASLRESERVSSDREKRGNGWHRIAAISGFAAAASAALTGVVVFVCMRHFVISGAKRG